MDKLVLVATNLSGLLTTSFGNECPAVQKLNLANPHQLFFATLFPGATRWRSLTHILINLDLQTQKQFLNHFFQGQIQRYP